MEHAKLGPSHSRGPEQDGMSYRAGFSGTSVAIIIPTRSGAVAAPARVRFPTPSFARVREHSTGEPCDSGFLSRTCFRGASCSRSRSTGIPGSLTSACSDSPFPRVHPSTHISHILESCRVRRLLALSTSQSCQVSCHRDEQHVLLGLTLGKAFVWANRCRSDERIN